MYNVSGGYYFTDLSHLNWKNRLQINLTTVYIIFESCGMCSVADCSVLSCADVCKVD